MKTEQLNYELPRELIAQQPVAVRSESRLLVFDRSEKSIVDSRFGGIAEFLRRGDCLVLNNTKVLQARFFARRGTGGRLEGLFLDESRLGEWLVMLRATGRLRLGEKIYLKDKAGRDYCTAEVIEKAGEGKCLLRLGVQQELEGILGQIGFAPLPPYIKRDRDLSQAELDKTRYQTVYAAEAGAVAAPTAGLHFTKELISRLEKAGVKFAYITLHVGMGTFKPVTTERLEEHQMHEEKFEFDEKNARIINAAKGKGGRIIAVGTTSTRVLETVASDSKVTATSGSTDLFIVPGYKFEMVDCLVTNFHLPKSSLLALVAAFAGLEEILNVYRYAVEKRYRFYSYGDAMLII